jgi:hypothetical protein
LYGSKKFFGASSTQGIHEPVSKKILGFFMNAEREIIETQGRQK